MTRPDFRRRSDQPELMDQPCDYATFSACLQDLGSVNRLTLAHRPTLAFLDRLRRLGRFKTKRPVRILDVGSGYGDLLRAVDRWADRHRLSIALTGLDLSPWSAAAASNSTPSARPITWVTANVFDYKCDADIIVSSLFTHHLSDVELVRFLAWMERNASVAWFVNDLHRHRVAHMGFRWLASAMRWHRFVRHDGPVSIERAFTPQEWRAYLTKAGLSQAQVEVQGRFPFRLCVQRVRNGSCTRP